MARDSVLGGVIDFFERLGVYDVILPFLLVFTLTYAIFEKSKVLGTEGKDGDPRHNLNAMASFVIAFLVVASSKLVEVITTISSRMVVLLAILVFFMLLIGTFYKKGDDVAFEKGAWRTAFVIVVLLAMLGIAFDAISFNNRTILETIIGAVSSYWSSAAIASIIFLVLIVLFMVYVTGGFGGGGDK